MPKLIYFDLGGRAEAIRMLLAHAKAQYTDERLSFPEFGAKKAAGEFPSGQVPVWVDDHGVKYNQTKAIFKMLAAEHGYESAHTPHDQYLVTWYGETLADFAKPEFMGAWFKDDKPDHETI